MDIYRIVLYFTIYSFLGWLAETIYCSIPAGKFVYRGFLNGPFCPIYGFGALLVIFLLEPFSGNLLLLFLAGVIVTSTLEYITSFVLEYIFHMTWWDYSKKKFNINGRVCLLNSTLFGILSVIAVDFLHPGVKGLVARLRPSYIPLIAGGFFLYFLGDFIITVVSLLNLKSKLSKLQEALDDKIHLEKPSIIVRRILNAFPNLNSKKYPESIGRIRANLKKKLAEKKDQITRKKGY